MWALITSLACALAPAQAQTQAEEKPTQPPLQENLDWTLAWNEFPSLRGPGPIILDIHTRLALESLIPAGRGAGGVQPENETDDRTIRLQTFLETPRLNARAQWEFSGNDVDFRELFAETRLSGVLLRGGQTREPAGLGALQGLGNTPFPERSAVSQAFTPGRNLGFLSRYRTGPWSAWLGAFRNSEEFSLNPEGEGESVTGRLTWIDGGDQPGEQIIHLGLWLSQRHNGLLFQARPGVRLLERLIDTGPLGSADALTGGLEFAWQRDGWMFSAEWQAANIDLDGSSAFLSGVYAQATWRPAGEARRYSHGRGAFRGFVPINPAGAAELALRIARTDLDDGSVQGGTQNDIGFGLNIQLSRRSRLMLHWQQSRSGDADLRTVLTRIQLGF